MSGPWDDYAPKQAADDEVGPWTEHAQKPKVAAVADLPQRKATAIEHAGNLGAGLLRGAGTIGSTLMWPVDAAIDAVKGDRKQTVEGLIRGTKPESRHEETVRRMNLGLQEFGVDTDSKMFGAGKITGEIAGTAGAGGAVANVLGRAAPVLAATGTGGKVLQAIASGGFKTGAPATATMGGKIADLGIRTLGGGVSGASSAALIDPSNTGLGMGIGAALPGVAKVGGVVGAKLAEGAKAGAKRLMQSAIKPTIAQLRSGDAATAIDVMLEHGINPSQAGVTKLRDLIGGLNDQITNKIATSGATVSKQKVLTALDDVTQQFGSQVSPTADLAAIKNTADDFLNHPNFVGDAIPVQAAQQMKQGTYRVLAKKYGQIGSADTEAQKGLARGLKDEIATAVPGVDALNATESKMIQTLGVVERRALMELNKNPVGLAGLAHSPASWALFMADKSAAFKALAARMVHSSANAAQSAAPRIQGIAGLPMLRATAAAVPSRHE